MKFKTYIIALVVVAAPGLAFAQGCEDGSHSEVMSCASGTSYDVTTGTCIPTASS